MCRLFRWACAVALLGCDAPTPVADAAAAAADGGGAGDAAPASDEGGVADAPAKDTGQLVFDVQLGEAKDSGGLDLGATTAACDLAKPEPGACGSPCSADNQCKIGFCTPTREARVCAGACDSLLLCPDGWACVQMQGAPDTVFGCAPRSPNLGRPCQSDVECLATVGLAVLGSADLCVAAGDEGAFCGSDCTKTDACPSGFACKAVTSIGGKPGKQCVATVAANGCTDRFEAEKAETVCKNSNASGVCLGKRHCQAKGLTPCSALTPAPEVCNGKDDDCDNLIDEPVSGATCKITVGSLSCPGTPLCTGGVETCVGTKPAPEACNALDDDCDGQIDEGCDDDKDGWCDANMGFDPAGKGVCPKGGGDCEDGDAGKYPTAKETCNGADDNCNGLVDGQDPLLTLADVQKCEKQAGVCAGTTKPALLCQNGNWLPCSDQTYTAQAPSYSQVEICDDKDNDCSGKADDGCNDDADGYCDAAMATIGFPLSCPKGGGDCNDQDDKAKPGSVEQCDDKDQNCNGQVDEGCDDDKDGQCDGDLAVVGTPKVCPNGEGDCDDLNPKRYKGAKELCNAVDDNCSGTTDETFSTLDQPCSDGKGVCAVSGKVVCTADGAQAVCSVAAAKPQIEICDNLDNDCNGKIDEGCDDDFDGYCDAAMAVVKGAKVCPLGGGDCDDLFGDVYPSAKEVCNAKDDDCDGKTDAGDGDLPIDDPKVCEKTLGVCKGAKKPASLCVGGQWLACGSETYAGWNSSHSAVEYCDGYDNDCSGLTDEGCDDDDDGYCNKNMKVFGFVATCDKGLGDCNDKDPQIFPLAVELCDNKDNDCNIKVDDGCDKDSDNFCDATKTIPLGVTPAICQGGGGDCDDNDAKINPGVKDFCGDFFDNNCSGQTDEGCPPTINGFVGETGPNFKGEGWLQCAGFWDQPGGEDVPLAWGLDCADKAWSKVRIACGATKNAADVRYIDVKKNVFFAGIANKSESGLIYNSNFPLVENLIKADSENPNASRSWWVSVTGCSEALPNLTVNNPSCTWEASNCFGLSLTGSRYLFVYVSK